MDGLYIHVIDVVSLRVLFRQSGMDSPNCELSQVTSKHVFLVFLLDSRRCTDGILTTLTLKVFVFGSRDLF